MRNAAIPAAGQFHYSAYVRACVRASRVVQYTRTEFAVNGNKNKNQSSPVLFSKISSWIWYTHHPSLIPHPLPPPKKTKWHRSICITSQGCQRVDFISRTETLNDPCGVPTDWSLSCSSAQTLLTLDCEWWNWGTFTGRRSRPTLRYHGISQQENSE